MLQRTVHRHKTPVEKVQRRPRWIVVGIFLFIAFGYAVIPPAGPRVRDVAIAEDELRAKIATLSLPPISEFRESYAAIDDKTRLKAKLGRLVFESTWLSRDGKMSCATCHSNPSDVTAVAPSAKPLFNLRWQTWFGPDGESDNLHAAVLRAIENPNELDSSRAVVAAAARTLWSKEYHAVFGDLPTALPPVELLVGMGGPEQPQLRLDATVAATGLASIGSPSLLDDIIEYALRDHIAPAAELARRALSLPSTSHSWQHKYSQLSTTEAAAVNKVFVNVGLALSTYLEGFVATDAPFDRFAGRLSEGKSVTDALGEGFSNSELQGLKLFLGPAKCVSCHDGRTMSDQNFHNLGLSQHGEHLEAGRAVAILRATTDPFGCLQTLSNGNNIVGDCSKTITLNPQNTTALGAFRTPSLRQLASKSGYMHDHRFQKLEDVLSYLNDPRDIPAIGKRDPQIEALDLTKEELAAIRSFLGSLNGRITNVYAELK